MNGFELPAAGIDDLNCYFSSLAVDYADIATARGFSSRDLARAGFTRRSVLPPFEDPVTMAVNAARPVVEDAGRADFGLLIVATETGIDYGKPISSYVHQALGLPSDCSNFELKHACYGGTAALQMAVAWVRTAGRGRRALVVTSDIARRLFGNKAELTGGAGAVAMSIALTPRLLELEEGSGCAAMESYDVARPTATAEWDDGVLSLSIYLDLLELAWEAYQSRRGSEGAFEERFAYMLYHVPFLGLVNEAHRQLLLQTDSTSDADQSFRAMVEPSLQLSREVGNIYAGSLFVALAGLLAGDAPLQPAARLGLYSYGSGSCAELFSGLVATDARHLLRARGLGAQLSSRRRLSLSEYEMAVSAVQDSMTRPEYEPSHDFPGGLYDAAYRGRSLLTLAGVHNYHRTYTWS